MTMSRVARLLMTASLGITLCLKAWALFVGMGQLSPVAKAISALAYITLIAGTVVLRRSRPESVLSPLGDNLTTLNLNAPKEKGPGA